MTGSISRLAASILASDREFIAHSTKMLHFPVRLSTSASSNHDLSLAAFITNIAESDFRYTQPLVPDTKRFAALISETAPVFE
jgi:hypothetical protein